MMLDRRLLILAQYWFDSTAVSRVFEPLIADWQREYGESAGVGRVVCRVRWGLAFAVTFALMFVREVRRPSPIAVEKALWGSVAAFIAVGTALLLIPFADDTRFPDRWTMRIDLLIPSALALAVPLAVLPAALIVLTDARWSSVDVRRTVVRMCATTLALTLAIAGWVSPIANQAYRVDFAAKVKPGVYPEAGPPRGPRELTLIELASREAPPHVAEPYGRGREFHVRLVVIAMPLALTILAFGIARQRRPRLWGVLGWWLATPLLWTTLTALAPAKHSADAIVWAMPCVVMLLATAFFAAGRSSIQEARHAE